MSKKNSPLRDRVRIQTTKREYPINIDDFVAFWKKKFSFSVNLNTAYYFRQLYSRKAPQQNDLNTTCPLRKIMLAFYLQLT